MTKADDDEIEAMPLVPDGNVELSHTAEESGEASKAIEASNQTDVGLQRRVGPRDRGSKPTDETLSLVETELLESLRRDEPDLFVRLIEPFLDKGRKESVEFCA